MSRLAGSDFLLFLDLTSWLVLLGIIFTWAMIDDTSKVHNYRQEHVLRNGYYLLAKSKSLRQQARNGMKWGFFSSCQKSAAKSGAALRHTVSDTTDRCYCGVLSVGRKDHSVYV